MKHAGIETGCISASLASCSFPLDPGHVDHNPHVTLVQVVADVRLLLGQHHRSLEKVLAPEHTKMVTFEGARSLLWNIVNFSHTPFASINSIVQPIGLVSTYWTVVSRSRVGLQVIFRCFSAVYFNASQCFSSFLN